jgi:nucleotide-binding universal stress UspA family protein
MITKILVPIDFSMCSKNALVFALQLADTIKADLRLLTVLDFDGSDMENTAYALDVMEERKVQSKNRIIKFIEKTTEKCSCIS